MNKIVILSATILSLVAGAAYAGFVQPATVIVDLDNGFAQGDQFTARTAEDDVSLIGCGIRVFDDGFGNSFSFGFCQATDAAEISATCFTFNPTLIDAIHGTSDYAFITFSFVDDGAGGLTCTRVGSSTQSFYLPKK